MQNVSAHPSTPPRQSCDPSVTVAAEGDRGRCEHTHPPVQGGCGVAVLGAHYGGEEGCERGGGGSRVEGSFRLHHDEAHTDVLATIQREGEAASAEDALP